MEKLSEIILGGKPVLVDFFATWCGPCQAMHPILEEVKQTMGDRIRVVTLNIDDVANRRIVAEYNIRSVPTLIIFKNGEQHWRQSGVVSSAKLISLLTKYEEEKLAATGGDEKKS